MLACFAALMIVTSPLRPAPQEPARARVEAWREDLRVAREDWLARDRSFDADARARCEAGLEALERRLLELRDEQIVVELARLAALSRNAHTRVYLLRNRSYFARLPLRLWWFGDELRVVAADAEHSARLGSRVVELCGRPVADARRAVDALYAGAPGWQEYMSVYTLTSPDVLAGLGLAEPGEPIPIAFEDERGARSEDALAPLAKPPADTRTEDWRNLSPLSIPQGWRSVLALDGGPGGLSPLLASPELELRSERLGGDVVYLRLTRSPGDRRADFERFLSDAAAELARPEVRGALVDLRVHTGGDLSAGHAGFEELAAAAARHGRRLVVLTSGVTFSAGVYHAAQLLRHPGVAWVGEAPGDAFTFWAEGGNVELPRSRLVLHYSDRLHLYSSRAPSAEEQEVLHARLELRAAPERVEATLDWDSYRRGADPALERALALARTPR